VLLAWYPGHNAARRRHANAVAINVGGWVWLIVALLLWAGTPPELGMIRDAVLLVVWLALVVWSYTASPAPPLAAHAPQRPRGYYGGKVLNMPDDEPAPQPPPSAFPVIADGPGRYKVSGVDRESKMDTSFVVHAESAENARVKGELEGIIVTRVEFQGRR
jgi:hypothetical protein